MDAKLRIKLFLIFHYCLLTLIASICFINTKIPDWLYKDYTPLDYFFWYFEGGSFLILIPALFIVTIVILSKNRNLIKSRWPFAVSLIADGVVGFYSLAICVARV